MGFHKIKSIKPLENMILKVEFCSGEIKKYDIKKLTEKYEIFKKLKDKEAFNQVKVDIGGYGIIWDDDIDLSSEEIWQHGENI